MAIAQRFISKFARVWLMLVGFVLAAVLFHLSQPTTAQDQSKVEKAAPEPKPKPKATKKPKVPAKPEGKILPLVQIRELREAGAQVDFPVVAGNALAYVHHNGTDDIVRVTQIGEDMNAGVEVSARGVMHHPAIAVDGNGGNWTFWGEAGEDGVMSLVGQAPGGDRITVSSTSGSESFAHAATDGEGRVWVVWQSMRAGNADIYAKVFELDDIAGKSEEIAVATNVWGEWEPRIAIDGLGKPWIVYDSAGGNEFNLSLASLNRSGAIKTFPIAHSPRYEARADLTPTADGSGFWISAERGRVRWGKDVRGHGNAKGLNAQTEVLFGKFDIASETFNEIPLGHAGLLGNPVNLPTVGVDAKGRPWVAYRYFERTLWRIGMTRYDEERKTWTSRRRIEASSFGQDRRSQFFTSAEGQLHLCWPSDLRKNKTPGEAGIFLAEIDSNLELPSANPVAPAKVAAEEPFSPSQSTVERERDDHATWEVGGKELTLYWGDVHRHTDVSNCRTGFDGCIAEHFRYAYDLAKLDFLGTSDHTDIGKAYSAYEWWHNQKMHDAFHAPGQFNSLYVYEREQRWPWGHRNIVFSERGGPIVYIQRKRYRESQWQAEFPLKNGLNEIEPTELWDVLGRYGKPVASISHTGATTMGTDWGKYKIPIDHPLETVVEIFQGARVSYEGIGAPQPTAGLRPGEGYTIASGKEPAADPPNPITGFGKHNAGVYQNALKEGHRLGVFASSDHIAQHVAYGGVYCEDFTREGIIKGLQSRITVAATDKIYVKFTCNNQPMGAIIQAEANPSFSVDVEGTATLKRVTIVRNEQDWKVIDDLEGKSMSQEFSDGSPAEGENRYYVRVEQVDGNMAWGSPIWVKP